jgi:hypothetical protein
MSWRERLVGWFGTTPSAPDPDSLVEVAYVRLADSQLILRALDQEGIGGEVVEEVRALGLGGIPISPMARLFVRSGDVDRAHPIIEATRSDNLGDDDQGGPS